MKSSIFLRDNGTTPRRLLGRPGVVNGGVASAKQPRRLAPLPVRDPSSTNNGSSGAKRPQGSWNSLDELVLHYTATGRLPPILSPTLPKEFELKSSNSNSNSKANSSNGSNAISATTPGSGVSRPIVLSDDEDIPLGLLSNSKSVSGSPRPLHLPLPKKPHQPLLLVPKSAPTTSTSSFVPSGTLNPTPSTSSTSSARKSTGVSSGGAVSASSTPQPKIFRLKYVRWVNRLADPAKPRLVLRIAFNANKARYASVVESAVVPIKRSVPSRSSSAAADSDSASPPPVGLGIFDSTDKQKSQSAKPVTIEHVMMIRNVPPSLVPPTPNFKQKTPSSGGGITSQIQKQTSPLKGNQKQASPLKSVPSTATSSIPSSLSSSDAISLISPPKIPGFVSVGNPVSVNNDDKNALSTKKNTWLKLAKETRAKVSKSRNRLHMTLTWMDSLILQMVSNDYDERVKMLNDVLPSERLWRNMLDDINEFLKSISKDNDKEKEKDKDKDKDKSKQNDEFYTLVVCLLYHTNALVLKRINNILTRVIDLYTKRTQTGTSDITNKVVDLQRQAIHNGNLMLDYLLSGNPNHMMSTISSKFPKTWYHRTTNIQNLAKPVSDLRPTSNTYYLPMGNYSSLSDISALTHNILREFIESNNINYVLVCSQKGI